MELRYLTALFLSSMVLLPIHIAADVFNVEGANPKGPKVHAIWPSSPPIIIDNDTDLKDTASANGWKGSGAPANPFIVENLTIDAKGYGACIFVGNTTLHFEVRNCSLSNASARSSYRVGGGLVLWAVRNGRAEHCSFRNNRYGVYCMVSSSCRVGNCTIRSVQNDAILFNCMDFDICFNDMSGSQEGLVLQSSDSNVLRNNSIARTRLQTLGLYGSNRNNISENIFHNNSAEVYIYQSEYNELYDNVFKDNKVALKVSTSLYNMVTQNDFLKNDKGLYAVSSRLNKVLNNWFDTNKMGAHLYYTDYTEMRDNTFVGNQQGVYLYSAQDNTLASNTFYLNVKGIEIDYDSDRNRIEWNLVWGNQTTSTHGVQVHSEYCNDNRMTNNTIGHNDVGVQVQGSDLTWIEDNDIRLNDVGADLTDANSFWVRDNYFDSNPLGFKCISSPSPWKVVMEVRSNVFIKGDVGASIDMSSHSQTDSRSLEVSGNRFDTNQEGLVLNNTQEVKVSENMVLLNEVGIRLRSSLNDIIYNNYLRNGLNVNESETSGTRWNVSKRDGTNIIYGPFLGGNFWSDYPGADIDGDGFGDENVPWGPGDHLPLVTDNTPPVITDATKGTPMTGKEFSVNLSFYDFPAIINMNVSFRYRFFDADGGLLIGSSIDSPHHYQRYFNQSFEVPEEAVDLEYDVTVTDRGGNRESLSNTMKVKDTIPPEAALIVNEAPVTGGKLTVDVHIKENIALSNVTLNVFHNGMGEGADIHYIDVLNLSGSMVREVYLDIPEDAFNMTLWVEASDREGNRRPSRSVELNVTDTIPPFIISAEASLWSDEFHALLSARVLDNIGVANVSFWISFDGGLEAVFYPGGQGGTWTLLVQLPLDATRMDYNITTSDIQGNSVSQEGAFKVSGSHPDPLLDQTGGSPMTGREFTVACSVHPGMDISINFVEVQFDEGGAVREDGTTSMTVLVPSDARTMRYKFGVSDSYGKWRYLERSLSVLDVIPPLVGLSLEDPVNGAKVEVVLDLSDNWGVSSHHLLFSFDDGPFENLTMPLPRYTIQVPEGAANLNLVGYVTDGSGNIGTNSTTLRVLDLTPPEMVYVSFGLFGNSGDYQVFLIPRDNREVRAPAITISAPGKEMFNGTMTLLPNGTYFSKTSLSGYSGPLSLSIELRDGSGNSRTYRYDDIVFYGDGGKVDRQPYLFLVLLAVVLAAILVLFLIYLRRGRTGPPEE